MNNYHLQEMSQLLFLKLWYQFFDDLDNCSEVILHDEVVDYKSQSKTLKDELSSIDNQIAKSIVDLNHEKALVESNQRLLENNKQKEEQLREDSNKVLREKIRLEMLMDCEDKVTKKDVDNENKKLRIIQFLKITSLVFFILLSGLLSWELFILIRQIYLSWGYDLSYIFRSTFFILILPATILLFIVFLLLLRKTWIKAKIRKITVEQLKETYNKIDRYNKRIKHLSDQVHELQQQLGIIENEISKFEDRTNQIDRNKKNLDQLQTKRTMVSNKFNELERAKCNMKKGVKETIDNFLKAKLPMISDLSSNEVNHLFAYMYLGLEKNLNGAKMRYQSYLTVADSNPSTSKKYSLSLLDNIVKDCYKTKILNPSIDMFINQILDQLRSYIFFKHSEPYFLLTKIDDKTYNSIPMFFSYDSSQDKLLIYKET